MAITNLSPVNKQHLALSVVALLLTVSSLFVISRSLQAAYLWLVIVLMMLLFFTTFTCSNAARWQRNTSQSITTLAEATAAENIQPCWVIDVPPSYSVVTGLPSGQTPPPCYRKLKFPPPPYQDSDYKSDKITDLEFRRPSLKTALSGVQPDVFSNQQRQNSVSSVQTLNFNICEG